ncbi:hypothetical protein BJ166DRAFT_615103 [Pestalotiopsis sp. NC0098]|nr:hypothetical protein BJ166DRAFT_615103 [Pestalotiopsis sp. NC0098]
MAFLVAGSAVLIAAQVVQAALYETVMQTKYGGIQGYPAFNASPAGVDLQNWAEITVWKGIPYAASTAGQNRFRQPQLRAPWSTTLDAKDFGDTCPGEVTNSEYTFSEDCLNLNIWSAANSSDAKLPVVMWSHPAESTSRDALFDGGGMADKGVILVNYNYRQDAFGWLAHPELSAEFEKETGSNSSGNWALFDQFAALAWIRENIEAFGGDPDHITVQGQSAGAAATYHILNSPLTKGQFVGAIIESGVRDPHDPEKLADGYVTLDDALTSGIAYLAAQNVTTIDELREIPWETLAAGASGAPGGPGGPGGGGGGGGPPAGGIGGGFSANLDYYAVPDTYLNTLINGLASDVPVITGNAKDENGATYGLNITLDAYLEFINETYEGEWAGRFLAQYPANDSATASDQENQQWHDRSKTGTWLWSQLRISNTSISSPVYNYLWDHAPPGQDRGAYHESEINYVLNNLYGTDLPWETVDYQIAAQMNDYWVNFIKTGNPNGGNVTAWDQVGDEMVTHELGDGWGPIPIASDDVVELLEGWFESLPPY